MTDNPNRAIKQVEVLLPKPFDHGFDYAVAEGMEARAGDLVRVPFGKQHLVGIVWGEGTQKVAKDKLKPIESVLTHLPPISDDLREYVDWVSRYTLAPKGMVAKMLMPVADALEPPSPMLHYTLSGKQPERASKARDAVLRLMSDGVARPSVDIYHAADVSPSVVKGLIESGVLMETPAPEKPTPKPKASPPTLSAEQSQAAGVLGEKLGSGFSVSVVDGVTGSGKTEVYFDTIARVLSGENGCVGQKAMSGGIASPEPVSCDFQGKITETHKSNAQVLVLLPEIALSVQWVERCEARFGISPHVWHSGLTPAQRRDTWREIATGEAKLVVGARSALFLPYPDLQLIIVDEEHEPSYKQEEGVIYQARDMAVARAHVEKIPAVLVSATPSLETVQNMRDGRYERVHLPERHSGVQLPEVRTVDMRHEGMESGSWVSPALRQEIADTLAKGRQAMLFLNRRGYAPLLLCRGCGHRFACTECSSWLVLHQDRRAQAARNLTRNNSRGAVAPLDSGEARRPSEPSAMSEASSPSERQHVAQRGEHIKGKLQCHHCGVTAPVPKACPSCGQEECLVACGPGVERVHEEVTVLFPNANVAMMTSDTMTTFGAARETVEAMTAGKIDILIGTQMMAKGYHFPALHLIGVIDADLGLVGGDLRAGERAYQLLHQVAGRAGREGEQGLVLLQTYLPEHPVMEALVAHDRSGFETLELEGREEAGYPPFGRLAALVVDGIKENEVLQTCRALSGQVPPSEKVRVLGPAPAPLTRLRGRYRYRFLVRADKDVSIQHYLREWIKRVQIKGGIRERVDIDPYSFL